MKITPYDILPVGTIVAVGNKQGYIASHAEKRDQFGNPIIVHTVQYTRIYSHKSWQGHKYKPYTKKEAVNYASINVLQEELR